MTTILFALVLLLIAGRLEQIHRRTRHLTPPTRLDRPGIPPWW